LNLKLRHIGREGGEMGSVRFSHIQGRSVGLLIEVADCVAVVQHNGMCVLPCDRTESRLKTIKTKVKRLTIAAGERRR